MSQLTSPVNEHDHRQGPDDAPAVLVEYGDFECPFCGHAHDVVKAIERRFGSSLQFVFRHFPLTSIHPHAELAAEAAEAAGAQGKFWKMYDALFENQAQLNPELIVALAQELDLDMQRFVRELNGRHYRDRVKKDFMSGVRSGVNGTPTFFINGERFDGSADEETLGAALMLAARATELPRAAAP